MRLAVGPTWFAVGLTDSSSEINFTGRALIHIKALAPVAGLVMLS
jgi:hypothetical protein